MRKGLLNNKAFFIVIMMLVAGSTVSWSQTNPDAILRKEMDLAVELMEGGRHDEADSLYRHVMANMKVLPAELAFYFGKNSYYLAEYKLSINWLSKYIELKGTGGQYYDECSSLLAKANEAFRIQEKVAQDPESIKLTGRQLSDCETIGKVICPVCQGQTVIVKKGNLGTRFFTCPYSDEHGYLTCEEYRLLLQGKLKPKR